MIETQMCGSRRLKDSINMDTILIEILDSLVLLQDHSMKEIGVLTL